MKKILGLVMGVILVIGCEIPDAGYQIPEEIVIVREPRITQINPYQIEYEQMLYPTVRINSPAGTGTGVIIATTDAHRLTQIYILTACHVVENENTINIELYNSTVITASVVITDTAKDLALLCALCDLCGESIYSASLAPESYTAYLFTPIYTVGCSLGLLPRPSSGIISAIGNDNWEVTSPILPGNSGGPVYAKSQRSPDNFGDAYEYEVIGIAVWVKIYNGQLVTTMAGIVPINQIYEFLQPQIHTDGHR